LNDGVVNVLIITALVEVDVIETCTTACEMGRIVVGIIGGIASSALTASLEICEVTLRLRFLGRLAATVTADSLDNFLSALLVLTTCLISGVVGYGGVVEAARETNNFRETSEESGILGNGSVTGGTAEVLVLVVLGGPATSRIGVHDLIKILAERNNLTTRAARGGRVESSTITTSPGGGGAG